MKRKLVSSRSTNGTQWTFPEKSACNISIKIGETYSGVEYKKKRRLPSSRSLTSLWRRSPSALRSLSIFRERAAASFSPVLLTAHPIFPNFRENGKSKNNRDFSRFQLIDTCCSLGRGNRPPLLFDSQLLCIPHTLFNTWPTTQDIRNSNRRKVRLLFGSLVTAKIRNYLVVIRFVFFVHHAWRAHTIWFSWFHPSTSTRRRSIHFYSKLPWESSGKLGHNRTCRACTVPRR